MNFARKFNQVILSSSYFLNRIGSYFKMPKTSPSIERPLIAICGCTGTGKSDLSVELARMFNGEVINADSMQIYKGLDIVTNKLSKQEMQGIPHHLMDFHDPCSSSYNVSQYRNAALPIVQRIWKDGKLPIIVGGTAYYIESVIYRNNLITTDLDEQKADILREELLERFPTCDLLHEELKRVDPDTAAQIHRNERYKVLRALEIFQQTGLTRSEHHKRQLEQMSEHFHFGSRLRIKNTLMILLDAEKEVLDDRLDKRVDAMLKKGLVDELDAFYQKHHRQLGSFGILQSIGLKEFLPYLEMTGDEWNSKKGAKMLCKSIELLKLHTRQYAKTQRKWFYNRLILRAKHREVPTSIVLNTSANFFDAVVPFAINFVGQFLSGIDVSRVSPKDPSVLMPLPPPKQLFDHAEYTSLKRLRNCEVCGIETAEIQWKAHVTGRRHRKALGVLAKKKRLADQNLTDNSTELPNSEQLNV